MSPPPSRYSRRGRMQARDQHRRHPMGSDRCAGEQCVGHGGSSVPSSPRPLVPSSPRPLVPSSHLTSSSPRRDSKLPISRSPRRSSFVSGKHDSSSPRSTPSPTSRTSRPSNLTGLSRPTCEQQDERRF
jgi:hypothetical protein